MINLNKIEREFWEAEKKMVPLYKGLIILFCIFLFIHLCIFFYRLPELQERRRLQDLQPPKIEMPKVKTITNWLKYSNEQIAAAIYWAEGGHRARVPYGILSVRVSSLSKARQACIETIDYSRRKFYRQTTHNDFIRFLGRQYAPPQAHPSNIFWVRNVKQILIAEVIQ